MTPLPFWYAGDRDHSFKKIILYSFVGFNGLLSHFLNMHESTSNTTNNNMKSRIMVFISFRCLPNMGVPRYSKFDHRMDHNSPLFTR